MMENVNRAQTGVQRASLIATVLHVKPTTTVPSAKTHVNKTVQLKSFATKSMATVHMDVQMGISPCQTLHDVVTVRKIVAYASLKLNVLSASPVTMAALVETYVTIIASRATNQQDYVWYAMRNSSIRMEIVVNVQMVVRAALTMKTA